MSQEKVARYKEAKANRKATMKKEKRARFIRNTITGVVLVAVIGWVGYSGVTYLIEHQPRVEVEADFDAIDEYASSLNAVTIEGADKESTDAEDTDKESTDAEGTDAEGTDAEGTDAEGTDAAEDAE